jgi:hypothetical protein
MLSAINKDYIALLNNRDWPKEGALSSMRTAFEEKRVSAPYRGEPAYERDRGRLAVV